MRLPAVAADCSLIAGIVLSAIATMPVLSAPGLRAQSPIAAPRPHVRMPDESAGVDAIARALIAAFDQVDIVALGEAHDRQIDSDLRLALIRNPTFSTKARAIVIECGSTTEQATLDDYIRGQSVPTARLARVWKATRNGDGFCNAPMYSEFLAAVRDVNSRLPVDARIRVFGGESGPGDSRSTVDVLREQVLEKHNKALVIYGSAHFYLTGPPDYLASMGDADIAAKLNIEYPGRTLSVIPIGALARPGAIKADVEPDFAKFDLAIKTQVRPVLLSLQRAPFRDLSASEFLGRTLTTCRGAEGCRSVFKGSPLTLGQMADAVVYVGR
jgi:Haem-binding uptake, Tiki superfamily, ChaN